MEKTNFISIIENTKANISEMASDLNSLKELNTIQNWGHNSKMVKTEKELTAQTGKKTKIYTYNLPAIKACPGAGECKKLCYADQGRYKMASVAEPREQNFSFINNIIRNNVLTNADKIEQIATSLAKDILVLFNTRLTKDVNNIIRLHDSGDMFHVNYMLGWFAALETLKSMKFNILAYAYTKSLPMVENNKHLVPENINITYSQGGLFDHMIKETDGHSKIFRSESELISAGYIDGSNTDIPAILGVKKIGLVYHGNKSLKTVEASTKIFILS